MERMRCGSVVRRGGKEIDGRVRKREKGAEFDQGDAAEDCGGGGARREPDRIESHETLAQWRRRMGATRFDPVHLGSNAFKQTSILLALFAGGEGYRVEKNDGSSVGCGGDIGREEKGEGKKKKRKKWRRWK